MKAKKPKKPKWQTKKFAFRQDVEHAIGEAIEEALGGKYRVTRTDFGHGVHGYEIGIGLGSIRLRCRNDGIYTAKPFDGTYTVGFQIHTHVLEALKEAGINVGPRNRQEEKPGLRIVDEPIVGR